MKKRHFTDAVLVNGDQIEVYPCSIIILVQLDFGDGLFNKWCTATSLVLRVDSAQDSRGC